MDLLYFHLLFRYLQIKKQSYNFTVIFMGVGRTLAVGLNLELLCHQCATSFTILSSYSFIGHYMFWPNWSSSGVQVIFKDSAAHCNAVFFLPIVVASGYFGYVGYHQFYLSLGCVVAFGIVECSCWGGRFVV
jgi:hypothetical protein